MSLDKLDLSLEDDDLPPNQPLFGGDFYREPDFSRGCSFGLSTIATQPGDFYREPDVTRSATTGPFDSYTDDLKRRADFGDSFFSDFGAIKADYSGPGSLPGKLHPLEPDSLAGGEFTPADSPPLAPTDEFWQYQNTKIQLETKGPGQGYIIGNLILAFLRNEVVASILKKRSPNDPDKNAAKFSVKAEVYIQNVMCTMKIRVYQEKACDNLFCVEFQRRSGDGVSYIKAYEKACVYLRESMGQDLQGKHEASDEPMAIDDPLAMPSVDEIKPLLDMAAMVHMPSLQADSATALAGLAEDRKRAPLLCTGQAFEQFQILLKCNQNRVAYPIARTLSSLAGFVEAAKYFVEQGILEIIVDKVRERTTSVLVQKHLVQTLSCAITHCLPFLNQKAVDDLLVGLSAAEKAGPVCDGYETAKEKQEWMKHFTEKIQDTRSKLYQYDRHRAAGGNLAASVMA